MRVRLTQIKALLLLAVFLASGTSVPSLDAALFHGLESDTGRAQTHLESAGDCPDHGGHCALGRTAPGSSAVAARPGRVSIQSSERAARQLSPPQARPEVEPAGIPRSRAPPARLV